MTDMVAIECNNKSHFQCSLSKLIIFLDNFSLSCLPSNLILSLAISLDGLALNIFLILFSKGSSNNHYCIIIPSCWLFSKCFLLLTCFVNDARWATLLQISLLWLSVFAYLFIMDKQFEMNYLKSHLPAISFKDDERLAIKSK